MRILKRGDVVVFKYPENENINYIKRIVGLPGDKILYKNKRLYIKWNILLPESITHLILSK